METLKRIAINTTTVVVSAAVGALVTIVINYLLVDIPVLKSKVSDLRDNQKQLSQKLENAQTSIQEAEKHFLVIEQFLYWKFNYNPSEFINIINRKNIPSEEVKKALSIPQKEAESYLIKNLNFTPDEAKATLSKPNFQNKR